MQILRAIWFRLRSMLQPTAINAEFAEELRFHIERETQENIKRGMNPDDARRTAHAQFGGVERFKENVRDEHGVRWLDDLSADVRHGLRLLRKDAVFSTAVIGTLALGIGATSTIFAIVSGVLLQSLPYPDADRIMSLSELHSDSGEDMEQVGEHAYRVWSASSRSFSATAIYGRSTANVTGVGEPFEMQGSVTTASFFSVLNARPAFGRTYTSEESRLGSEPVILISHRIWKSAFGGDSTVLQRSITLNGISTRIIGVMPPEFGTPWRGNYWLPLRAVESHTSDRPFNMIGRLRTGVRPVDAVRELTALVPRLDAERSPGRRGDRPMMMSLHDRLFGPVKKPLAILFSSVVVLLLIACANVANLTLARSALRQREFAVRLALGAGRWRLVRQLLVENSLLAGIGGLCGAIVPFVLVDAFISLSPASVARVADIQVDSTVLLFTTATTVLVALAFGLMPALVGARGANSSSLAASSTRNAHARAQNTFRASLIVLEVSGALVLLTAAGLLTSSFVRATSVNPGFDTQDVYVARFNLPRSRYPNTPGAAAFFESAAQRVRALPGVAAVSASAMKPLGGLSITLELPKLADDSVAMNIGLVEVDGQYGNAARLHLVDGRFIDDGDVKGSPLVAMISSSTALHFFPGQKAVGQLLPKVVAYREGAPPVLVVGVVEDMLQVALDVAPMAQIFVAGAQGSMQPQFLIIRTSMNRDVLYASLKRIIAEVDPSQPVTEFTSVREDVAKSVAPRRFNSVLINVFAGLALLLAAIGLYGLLANTVAARTREIGIRIALGAQSQRVMRLVLAQGMSLVALGVLAGTALSLALSRTVSSLLFNVPANDPTIFVLAAVSLIVVALLACYIPARRATLVSPTTALRQE
ncbi:MAG: ABC transporter permease [Gemmatimonas sp.]